MCGQSLPSSAALSYLTPARHRLLWVMLYSAVLNICSAQINSEIRSRVVAFLLHVLKVPVSRLETDTEHSDLLFRGFSQFMEASVGRMPPVRKRNLIRTFFKGF